VQEGMKLRFLLFYVTWIERLNATKERTKGFSLNLNAETSKSLASSN